MAVRFQPLDPEFLRDPYPIYAQLRAESPIHRVRMQPLAIGRMIWRTARERIRESEQGVFATLRAMNAERRSMSPARGQGARRSRHQVSTSIGGSG